MSDDARLARLSGELDAALARITALQEGGGSATKKALPSRVAAHVSRRGSLILNVALAGATFAVAAGRLSLQRQHEVRDGERKRTADALFAPDPCQDCSHFPSFTRSPHALSISLFLSIYLSICISRPTARPGKPTGPPWSPPRPRPRARQPPCGGRWRRRGGLRGRPAGRRRRCGRRWGVGAGRGHSSLALMGRRRGVEEGEGERAAGG